MGAVATVVIVPRHTAKAVAATVLVAAAAIASAGGKLPFRLCRQAVILPCHGIQLAQKLLYVVPAYILHRQVVTLELAQHGQWYGSS